MADQNDLNKPDLTSNYSNEVLETIRGHITRLWKGDYTGMGNLVSGLRRWVKVGTVDAKLVERDSAGAETTIVDTSLLARATGSNATGTWGVNINNTSVTTTSLTVNGSTSANGNVTSTGLVQGQKLLGISTTGDDEAARFQHSSTPFISFFRAGSRAGYLQSTATTFAITSETSQYVDIITGGTPRFSVSASGNVRSFTSGGGKLMDQASIRAWAKFNMSGAVGNQTFTGMGISSVVKNADNSLTINLSDPMPDANYAILQGPGIYSVLNGLFMDATPVFSTTSFRINCVNPVGTVVAPTFVSFAVVR